MLIPYSTDAPIYYWPIATVGLIAINTFAFFLSLAVLHAEPGLIEACILQYGRGLHPLQWITSNFLHLDIFHLLGNMMFLWAFGLIVEGKVGPWKFLLIYMGIGITQCAIEQTLTLGMSQGGSLGASAIVYGLMAISLVWAPKNDMSCLFFIMIYPISFDAPVLVMAGFSIFVEFTVAAYMAYISPETGVVITSAILHLMGAGLGIAVGVAFVKFRWVDCENWDLFSVIVGRHTMTRDELAELRHNEADVQKQMERRTESETDKIRKYIEAGQPAMAQHINTRLREKIDNWALPADCLLGLIKAFHAKSLWTESIEPMREYLGNQYPNSELVRLKLAQILVEKERRAAQALKVLSQINAAALNPAQQQMMAKVRAKAEALHSENPYEVADDW